VTVPVRRTAISAVALTSFQILGMALPMMTLPVLARSLGVVCFGQIMLAQFVVLFGVVFIDAGLNLESQRRVAAARDELARTQALLDNLIARALLALPVTVVVVAAGLMTPGLPLWMVLVALLHMGGTLLFPQWWFVARDEGLRMGLAMTVGRVVSAVGVLLWVRVPADAGIALLAASSASLLSGLLFFPALITRFFGHASELNLRGYRLYLRVARPALVSAFVASSSQSVPAVVLGAIGGTLQVGIFSAADRLTRAAAYVAGVAGLSLLNVATRAHAVGPAEATVQVRAILRRAAMACAVGSVCLAAVAVPVIHLLYGNNFSASVMVLELLSVWLGLHVFRVLKFTLQWKAAGCQVAIARLQLQEGLVVLLLSLIGAWLGGAAGVAIGLVVSELCLLLGLRWAGQRHGDLIP
jgi:polysaccharide transporter, PST family